MVFSPLDNARHVKGTYITLWISATVGTFFFVVLIPAHPTTNYTNQVTEFMQHFHCEKSSHMQDQNKN